MYLCYCFSFMNVNGWDMNPIYSDDSVNGMLLYPYIVYMLYGYLHEHV